MDHPAIMINPFDGHLKPFPISDYHNVTYGADMNIVGMFKRGFPVDEPTSRVNYNFNGLCFGRSTDHHDNPVSLRLARSKIKLSFRFNEPCITRKLFNGKLRVPRIRVLIMTGRVDEPITETYEDDSLRDDDNFDFQLTVPQDLSERMGYNMTEGEHIYGYNPYGNSEIMLTAMNRVKLYGYYLDLDQYNDMFQYIEQVQKPYRKLLSSQDLTAKSRDTRKKNQNDERQTSRETDLLTRRKRIV